MVDGFHPQIGVLRPLTSGRWPRDSVVAFMSLDVPRAESPVSSQASSGSTPSSSASASRGPAVRSLWSTPARWVLLLLAFVYLWFRLIDNLRVEWTTNPTYSYGWIVPVLCIGLLLRRWQAGKEMRTQGPRDPGTQGPRDQGIAGVETTDDGTGEAKDESPSSILHPPSSALPCQPSAFSPQPLAFGRGLHPPSSILALAAFAALALLYLPTRLVEAATPEWRPIQWSLAIITIGLTLCAIGSAKGRHWLWVTAFPIAFLLVAIPWPTLIETPIIQRLTQANSALVIEILGIIGIPAVQHGNLIEVGTGTVGIDEACSGIRSFQSSLMISLFIGEFCRLGLWRRLFLVPIGFLVAFGWNVCRTTILTWIAARKGVAAISDYHDQAGLTILLACTATMWAVAWIMKKRAPGSSTPDTERSNAECGMRNAEAGTSNPELGTRNSESVSHPPSAVSLQPLALSLLAWLLFVEVGVEVWYRSRETNTTPGPRWSLEFPTNNPTFKVLPMSAKTENLLRFDHGKQGAWQEPDGTSWQAFYFEWLPGRVAGYLAKRHTPEICMPAAGRSMVFGPKLVMLNVHGLELPMRAYVFKTPGAPLHVFQCRWEAGATQASHIPQESARFNLIRAIWAGRGKQGQKVLEFVVSGMDDIEVAKSALVKQLEKLVQVELPGAP